MMNESAQQHKQNIASIFSNASDIYGKIGPAFFEYFGRKLVDYADINEGFNVLDIACGRGSSLFPAHKKIGITGHITGIDISPEMVKLSRSDAESRGLKNISIVQMDAEELNFPDESFDTVLSGFSLFFLPDLQKCLGEIKRVLKIRGMFATTTWARRDEKLQYIRDLISSLLPGPYKNTQNKIISLHSSEEIIGQFSIAGFNNVEIQYEAKEFYYKNEDEWFQSLYSHGMRSVMEKMNELTLEIFKRDAFNFLSSIKNGNGIPEIFSVYYTKVFKD
ncbi:MAG: methyltransferase domain-containing protein [bacterium]